jgi:hypothetical protein
MPEGFEVSLFTILNLPDSQNTPYPVIANSSINKLIPFLHHLSQT